MNPRVLPKVSISSFAESVLREAKSVRFFSTVEELAEAAVPKDQVDERATSPSATTSRAGSSRKLRCAGCETGSAPTTSSPTCGAAIPNCMVIADDRATDKQTLREPLRRGLRAVAAGDLRWLKTQDAGLLLLRRRAARQGPAAVAICPANAAFFAFGSGNTAGDRAAGEDQCDGRGLLPLGHHLHRAAVSSHALRRQAGRGAQPPRRRCTSCSATTCTPAPRRRRASTACC